MLVAPPKMLLQLGTRKRLKALIMLGSIPVMVLANATLGACRVEASRFVSYTPPENERLEPKNDPTHLPNLHFWVP